MKLEKKKFITALKNDKCSLEEASDYLRADQDVALTAIKVRKNCHMIQMLRRGNIYRPGLFP